MPLTDSYTPPPGPGAHKSGKRVFVSTDHAAFYPVGVASVIVAHDEAQARGLLDSALKDRGLNPNEPYTLQEVGAVGNEAVVLCDGNY